MFSWEKPWGYVLKLIAFAEIQNGSPALWVAPAFVPKNHPLGSVSGAFNALSVYGHAVGHTLYYGRGAGASPTASAVVGDIINAASGHLKYLQTDYKIWPGQTPSAKPMTPETQSNVFYLRIKGASGLDENLSSQIAALGQLGRMTDQGDNLALATERISLEALTQVMNQLRDAGLEVQAHPIIGSREEFTTGL
jgi:hypothetical protein